jgi:mono/diheme cytochrome c family protein
MTTRFASSFFAVAAVGTGFAQAPAQDQATFAKDVAPIFQSHCQTCHRPNNIAPMSLLTYQDARPWARAIKQQVVQRNMPPWFEDRAVGIQKFKNDPSLTDQEISTIVKWVDSGAAMGNPADLPPPRKFDDSDRWHIGKPDVVITLKKDVLVKSGQADQWLDLPTEDPGIRTDRYIQAVEVKPIKGVKVVHHAVASMKGPDDDSVQGSQHLEEYAVGKFGDIFPDGTGMLMKAGTQIMMNVHLHAIGVDTTANLAVGLKLYPEGVVPKHIEISQHVGDDNDLDIPPNTKNVRADGYTVLMKPARITAFQPHMHNRGQAQCLELIYPNSTTERAGKAARETVSCVDRWKFDWHIVYHFEEEVQPIVPAGTIVHIISLFDNTAANKFNPDPSNALGFGQRTIDEMSFAWLSFYYLTDDEYKQMIAERKSSPRKTAALIRQP